MRQCTRLARRLPSDRTKRPANQFRLVLHTAAYWLRHTLRGLAPKRSFWRDAQLDTIGLALIKVVGRVTELASRIELPLPSGYPYRDTLTLLAARAARPPWGAGRGAPTEPILPAEQPRCSRRPAARTPRPAAVLLRPRHSP